MAVCQQQLIGRGGAFTDAVGMGLALITVVVVVVVAVVLAAAAVAALVVAAAAAAVAVVVAAAAAAVLVAPVAVANLHTSCFSLYFLLAMISAFFCKAVYFFTFSYLEKEKEKHYK